MNTLYLNNCFIVLLIIPNQLDFMHKIIILGVHEIAALVAKIACVWWLDTIFVARTN